MTDNKTATELRRILDALDIEHSDFESAFRYSTCWKDSHGRVIEHQVRKDADFGDMGIVRNLMPKQAIAATLGAGECHVVEHSELPYPVCSECGAILPEDYTVYYCWSCGAKVVKQ